MLKGSSWRIDETNLANFGSELDKKHRKEEGALETAWNYENSPIGRETGTWVWRVKDFNLTSVPEKQYGQFYRGDSYIVLKSSKKGNTDALIHHIHFWLGTETSQDEAGTAAYKTVELDDFLDALAIQHRELQGRESSLFYSYFKSFRYLKGGYDSGFVHVEEDITFPTRLLRVHKPANLQHEHTHNSVVITQLSRFELNSNAVFIIDTGDIIYQWQGKHANGIEHGKAAGFITQLISERDGSGKMVVAEQGSREQIDVLKALGGLDAHSISDEEIDNDGSKKRLLRVDLSNNNGDDVAFDVVAEGETITQDMFESDHVYVFDVGHQVFTWIGKNASRKEKRNGLSYAQKYIKEHQGPSSSFPPICQMMEGGEDELFKASLQGWQGW